MPARHAEAGEGAMRVLNVEDRAQDSALIERELRKRFGAVALTRVETPEAFAAALQDGAWDLVIADHRLPRFSSLAALAALQASGRDLPLIVVSGTMGVDFAVEAMRAGARDYLVKSDLVRLGAVVEREVRDAAARRLLAARHVLTGEVLEVLNGSGELAPQLRGVLERLRRHAGADAAGIRLRAAQDFPYAMQVGFDEAFLAAERTLCQPGGPAADPRGGCPADLACLCGAVLLQRPEAAGLLTPRGAYVTGALGADLGRGGQASALPHLRGRCALDGYQSLALLPLRSGPEVVGLLQLNARAPDRFDPALVQFLEEVAPSLGLAVERRRAEEALHASQERYRVLVETSPNGVALAGPDQAILMANGRLAGLLGLAGAEALEGRRLTDFVAEEDRARAAVELAQVVSATGRGESVLRFRHGEAAFEGEVSSAATAGPDGERASLVVVIRDVTERRRLQARLAQSDRMASVGMLAAGVAHEINNPLTYVLFNLESLAADLPAVEAALPPSAEPPELVQRAREALEGGRRIREIVRDLRVFSRAGDDRLAPVQVNRVIEGAVNMTHHEVKYRARLVLDLGALPPVRANEGRLAQVFLNLLVNAAQAIPEGDVERNRITIRTWSEGAAVLAEVRDTGAGIPPEHLARIFDPFFTTKPAGIGTGLGLAISRGIVEEAGGRITVESRPGEGARFLVQLPAIAEEVAPARAPPPGAALPPPAGRRGRVLVVDDEAIVRSAVVRLLRAEHDTAEAASGREAEALLFADDGYDVILSDLIMPEVSGMDLYQGLAASRPDLAARMVFMSGGAFTAQASLFLEQVANIRIDKPFDASNLRKLVRVLVAARGG
ncbi:MAG: response regulator [Anaeromyxobacter sp.]|nr:response regulator [Anaeromyxobacter sp.]